VPVLKLNLGRSRQRREFTTRLLAPTTAITAPTIATIATTVATYTAAYHVFMQFHYTATILPVLRSLLPLPLSR